LPCPLILACIEIQLCVKEKKMNQGRNRGRECKCGLDNCDLGHFKPSCFKCGGSIEVHAVCGCWSQCGCQLGVWCKSCQTPQQPKVGEGWCPTVRAVKSMLKPGKCIKMGCKKDRHPGKDYCGKTCAREDGAL